MTAATPASEAKSAAADQQRRRSRSTLASASHAQAIVSPSASARPQNGAIRLVKATATAQTAAAMSGARSICVTRW